MLTGDLSDFSLRNVIDFLAAARKSGLLTLRSSTGDGGVFLRDGRICLALVDVTRVPLGPRMVALGLLDREGLRDAGTAVDGTTFGLACGLMRGASDREAANALAGEHTREAVAWLDQYEHASFVFDCTVAVDAWPFDALPATQILADVEHSAAQWSQLRALIGDLALVPSCVVDPASWAQVDLTGAQWRIIALTDGHRSINDLIELSGLSQLETCRELATLVEHRLVELVRHGGHSGIDLLVSDARAVDAHAFGRAAHALDDASRFNVPEPVSQGPVRHVAPAGMPSAPAGSPTVSPAHTDPAAKVRAERSSARSAAAQHQVAHDAVEPATRERTRSGDAPSDTNAGLLNRLIDGVRST